MKCHRTSSCFLVALFVCLTSLAARLEAQSPSAEDKLLEVLKSSAPAEQKCNACRELKTAGTEKSIPALAALLTDAEVSHTARIALESMPYPAAGAALREAAGKAAGLIKAGILDSLGERRDAEALPLLTAALEDKELQIVAAAATALGKIGNLQAAGALAAGRAKAQGDARTKITDGWLLAADRLLGAGNRDEAARIYRELSQPSEPRVIRAGALRGMMQTGGVKAIVESLAVNDVMVRAAAAGQLPRLSAADFGQVAAGMTKLPADSQVSILMAIRVRADKSFSPLLVQAAKSKDESIRLAALRAMGTAGDAAALPVLVELASLKDKTGETARQSLEAICGPQIDEGIVAALRAEKDPARRAGWIALLELRKPAGAVAVLLDEATKQSPAVRSRAMTALAKVAGPGDVPAMVAVVLKTEKGPQRDDAERAVRLVCQQIADPEARAAAVLTVFRGANAADRIELLPLLGRLGGSEARQAVQEALDSSAPALSAVGLQAICNWPDASVAETLLKLSQTAKSDQQRLQALRAFIRVIPLPGKATDAEKLAMLRRAMELAGRDEERNYILERASAVRSVEALRFVLPYLDQPALAQEAAKSVVELGRRKELRDPNKAEFGPALQKALKTSTDATTLERARRYLQAMNPS
jgi:HEAT repeat protein